MTTPITPDERAELRRLCGDTLELVRSDGWTSFVSMPVTDLIRLLDALDQAEREREILRDVLVWYADPRTYESPYDRDRPYRLPSLIEKDKGARALQALDE